MAKKQAAAAVANGPATATAAAPKKTAGRIKTTSERPEGKEREVLYPRLEAVFCIGDGSVEVITKTAPAITAAKMKDILGWQSEAEYTGWMIQKDPSKKEDDCKFPDIGEQLTCIDDEGTTRTATVLCTDEYGSKIICWNVTGNRHFDDGCCGVYIQDLLNKQWSGPSSGEETFNGETFVVGKTGKVESGQHRGVALVRAWQRWMKDLTLAGAKGHWQNHWPKDKYPDGPVMDVPIFFGISESPKVIRTLDIGRRRTTSDTIETSPIFKDLKPAGRRECSKMMDSAVDLLWARTGAGKVSSWHEYATPSELLDMIDRHPKLKKAVLHLFRCNKERVLARLKLSAGQCAAIMYLQAAGNSDINAYRNCDPLPAEKALDLDLWQKAEEFWSELVTGEGPADVVRDAIARVVAEDEIAITAGKFAILSRAWTAYLAGGEVSKEEVQLTDDLYQVDQKGNKSLALAYVFNATAETGIDLGPKIKKGDTGAEADEVESEKARVDREKKEAREAAVAKAKAKIEEAQAAAQAKGTAGFATADPSKPSAALEAAKKKLAERAAAAQKPAEGALATG